MTATAACIETIVQELCPHDGTGVCDDYRSLVVQARMSRDELRQRRVWVLRKGWHEAAIHFRPALGVGDAPSRA